jgi:hypothetical protein
VNTYAVYGQFDESFGNHGRTSLLFLETQMVVADTYDFGVAPIQCLGHILAERCRRSLYLYTFLAAQICPLINH